jgi:TATA-box binding protein (TBP) (component of TFIID and TFIIIB)
MCLLRDILESAISPPAIYYIDRPKLTMLIFQNGNTIIAGAKSEEEEGLVMNKVQMHVFQHVMMYNRI